MPPLQTESRSSASTSSETQTQSLREVHERLVSFIAAHTSLGKATLSLADSIVEFYSPQVKVWACVGVGVSERRDHRVYRRIIRMVNLGMYVCLWVVFIGHKPYHSCLRTE